LLKAYHGDGKDPGNVDVLVEAAQSVGLDAAQAREVLESGQYAAEVRAQERNNQAMGIQSVPSIIFNRRHLMTGGQPVEAFVQGIQQILSEAAA
jgi:predicted DsbA family dithiol-disulfide isomerase